MAFKKIVPKWQKSIFFPLLRLQEHNITYPLEYGLSMTVFRVEIAGNAADSIIPADRLIIDCLAVITPNNRPILVTACNILEQSHYKSEKNGMIIL